MANFVSPWYPQVDDESQIQNYIYLTTLKEDKWHRGVYTKAENKFNLVMSSLSVALFPQLNELYALAQREERKEIALLEDFVNKGSLSPQDAGNKLRGFNRLYQNKNILARNLKKITAVADGGSQGRIDIASSFRTYLSTAIDGYFARTPLQKINEDSLLEITKQALIKALSSADTNQKGEESHSYQELVSSVEMMENQDPFIREAFQIYFGTAWEEIKKELKTAGKRKKGMKATDVKNLITKSHGAGGELFETLQGMILESLGQKSIHTGGSKQKSDMTLLYADIKIPMDKANEAGASIRAHFINKYREMYNNLEEATGSIVEISAKNYNLTSAYFKDGGFSAQSATSIKNLEEMLKAYGYNPDRTDRLIFALTNIGPDTIQEDAGSVTHNLAMLIAYFLFDDIDMDDGLGVNAVHLLNLDGIYIPLSCFLYAAYDSLSNFERASQDLVKVSYFPQSVDYQPSSESDPLTKKKWQDTVKTKQNQDSIRISFFQNFPQYIKKNLSNFDFQ